jgi:cold shock CspA family protein
MIPACTDSENGHLEEGQRVALNYHGGNDGLQANVVTPPSPDSAGGP